MLFPPSPAPSPVPKSDPILLSHCTLFFSYLVLILICNYILICVIIFKCLKQSSFFSEPRRRGIKRPMSQRASGARNLKVPRKWPEHFRQLYSGGSYHMGTSTFLPWLAEYVHWPSHPTPQWFVIHFFSSLCSMLCHQAPPQRIDWWGRALAGWEGTDAWRVVEGL